MKKYFSIFLIAILLLGNVGVTFGTHYCMGIPVDSEWMIGQGNMDCDDTDSTHENEDQSRIKMDCCSDSFVSLETVEVANSDLGQTKVNLDFVASYIYSILSTDFPGKRIEFSFRIESPLRPTEDILIRQQAFLI